jgi:hypothetical protein
MLPVQRYVMPMLRRPIDCRGPIARSWFGATVGPTLLALTIALPAAAQDYKSREVAGWTVAPSQDGKGCFMTQQYDRPGDTTLLLGVDVDGGNHLSVLNGNWSIKPKEQLKLNFRLTSGGYTRHFAVGMASEGKRGFVTSFDAKFPTYFASSLSLHISRGDVPVERLALTGSGAAVAALRTCVAVFRDRPPVAAVTRERIDDIPRDPFSRGAGRKTKR